MDTLEDTPTELLLTLAKHLENCLATRFGGDVFDRRAKKEWAEDQRANKDALEGIRTELKRREGR
jgi:hypothetical protein